MRQRHRPPSIFSLSMLDVFACSLGCVTLLWLMNMREADRLTQSAQQTEADLKSERGELALSREEALKLTRLLAASQDAVTLATTERDDSRKNLEVTNKDLEAALSRLAALEKDLLVVRKERDDTTKALTLREKDNSALVKERDDLKGRIPKLETLLDEQTTIALNAEKKLKLLGEEMALVMKRAKAAEEMLAQIQPDADALPGTKTALKDAKSALGAAEERISKLERELKLAQSSLIDLAGQKKVFADEVDRLRAAADNRFAGIDLKGKRIVFVIDISGSMLLVEAQKPDPNKWDEVRQTVVKLLKSMPELEKFQVVLFSDVASVPLGEPGKWMAFDKTESPKQVDELLKKTTPKGGTNMYAGLEAAFALRDQGLDAVFLMSDGLPSLGVGLPAKPETLSESQRVALLSGQIRSTLKSAWNPPNARQRVKINALGFFYESPDVGAFLWALARENEGAFVGMSKP